MTEQGIASSEEFERYACSTVERAIAAYIVLMTFYDPTPSRGFIATMNTIGLSLGEASKIYRELGRYLGILSYQEFERVRAELKEVVIRCLDRLNIAERARERIDPLGEDERRILRIASLGIIKEIERSPHIMSDLRFKLEELAAFVSIMVGKEIDPRRLEDLIVGSYLAVSLKDYGDIAVIPNTIELISILGKGAEGEMPDYQYIYSKIRHNLEPHQIAALLGKITYVDHELYRAVYGYEPDDIAELLTIEKIVYRGHVNKYVEEHVLRAIKNVVKELCIEIADMYFREALRKAGYTFDLNVFSFSEEDYYCKYTAVKPGSAITLYIHPVAAALPEIPSGERAVIVVSGAGADIPSYIDRLRQSSLYASAASSLWAAVYEGNLYILGSTVEGGWKKEFIEALERGSKNVYIVGAGREGNIAL